jgi:hypothetical protein
MWYAEGDGASCGAGKACFLVKIVIFSCLYRLGGCEGLTARPGDFAIGENSEVMTGGVLPKVRTSLYNCDMIEV